MLFEEGEILPKPLKVNPKHSDGAERAAMWLYANRNQAPGVFMFSLLVSRGLANTSEIEIAIASEALKRKEKGLDYDEFTVKRALVLKSGIFQPADTALSARLGIEKEVNKEVNDE